MCTHSRGHLKAKERAAKVLRFDNSLPLRLTCLHCILLLPGPREVLHRALVQVLGARGVLWEDGVQAQRSPRKPQRPSQLRASRQRPRPLHP